MWLKESNIFLANAPAPPLRVVVNVDRRVEPKTAIQKYYQAHLLSKKICSILSHCGSDQFRERYECLQQLHEFWARGGEVVILKILGPDRALRLDGKGETFFLCTYFSIFNTISANFLYSFQLLWSRIGVWWQRWCCSGEQWWPQWWPTYRYAFYP